MKRFAIVRVDERCPDDFEKIDVRFVCRRTLCYKPNCKNVLYGDTKEQLELKIQNAITRFFMKKSPNLSEVEKKFLLEVIKEHKLLAKEIIESLGVEE